MKTQIDKHARLEQARRITAWRAGPTPHEMQQMQRYLADIVEDADRRAQERTRQAVDERRKEARAADARRAARRRQELADLKAADHAAYLARMEALAKARAEAHALEQTRAAQREHEILLRAVHGWQV